MTTEFKNMPVGGLVDQEIYVYLWTPYDLETV